MVYLRRVFLLSVALALTACGGPDVAFEWVDEQDLSKIVLQRSVRGAAQTCYYYLRVTQEDGEIAWSSPIWFSLRG